MKQLKKLFLSLPLLAVALVNMLILASIPRTEGARSYKRNPCTALGKCGSENGKVIPRRHESAFDHMFEIFSMPITLNSLFEQQQRQIANMYKSSAPRYDITEDNEKMELTFDMPGVHAKNISLDLQQGGQALTIKGVRKYRQHGQVVQSEFDQIFTIDPTILDIDHITANLSDGVLVVSAPKVKRRVELQERRKIPILANMEVVKNKPNADQADGDAGQTEMGELEITEEEDI